MTSDRRVSTVRTHARIWEAQLHPDRVHKPIVMLHSNALCFEVLEWKASRGRMQWGFVEDMINVAKNANFWQLKTDISSSKHLFAFHNIHTIIGYSHCWTVTIFAMLLLYIRSKWNTSKQSTKILNYSNFTMWINWKILHKLLISNLIISCKFLQKKKIISKFAYNKQ